MAQVTRDILKSYFRTGAYPTEEQFAALIDSLRHYLDDVPMSKVTGLNEALNGKASADIGTALDDMLKAAQASAQSATTAAATAGAVQTDYYNNIKPEIRAALSTINGLVGIDKVAVFDDETDYTKDSLVLHDDKLYIFTADHSAGAWSTSDVSQTSMWEMLEEWASVTLPGYLEQIEATDKKADTVLTTANNTVIEAQKTVALNRLVVGSEVIPEFDAANMYEVNSLILYNGVLYKWLVQHEEGVEWNTTDVKATSLYNEYLYLSGIDTTREQVDLRLSANKGIPSFTGLNVTVELSSVSLVLATVTLSTSDGDKTITFDQEGTASFTVSIDEDGYVKFEVPQGVTYHIVCPEIAGYHTPQLGNKTAYLAYRILGVKYIYKVTTPGIYVVFDDGTMVESADLEQWIADNPTVDLQTAVMIYCASNALISRGCCFGFKIDDVVGKVMPTKQIANNGNNTVAAVNEEDYDGKLGCLTAVNNHPTWYPSANYATSLKFYLSNSVLQGFIGARYQWQNMYDNKDIIDNIISQLRPSSSPTACSDIMTTTYTKVIAQYSVVFSGDYGPGVYFTNKYNKVAWAGRGTHYIFTFYSF